MISNVRHFIFGANGKMYMTSPSYKIKPVLNGVASSPVTVDAALEELTRD
jgi:hypothetical protein